MRTGDKLEELAQALHGPRERYLKWKQVVGRYELGKHTKLATIIKTLPAIEKTKPESISSLQQRAYCSEEYKRYLEEWDEAEKKMVQAQVEFENLLNDYEAYVSALSFDKELIKARV